MSIAKHRRRSPLRLALDLMLVALAGLLLVASVDHLGRKVSAIHGRELDLATFRRWAALQPVGVFSAVRIVATAPTVDVVCATRAHRRGRTCIAVRQDARGARVVASAFVAPGHPAVRDGRLVCPRGTRRCTIGAGRPPGGAGSP